MRAHAETVNDCAKLIMHRLGARMIAQRPELVGEAVAALGDVTADEPAFVERWRVILREPDVEILRLLVSRSETMTRLRSSSPFSGLAGIPLKDVDLRRRIWRLTRRHVEIGPYADGDALHAPFRHSVETPDGQAEINPNGP